MSDGGTRSLPSLSIRALVLRSLLLFAAAAAAATLSAWPIGRAYNAGRIDVVLARELGYAETARVDIETALREILADLRVAARLPAMQQYLHDPTAEREQTLAGAFKNIMEAYQRYSQIRLLDMSGREIVRINQANGRAVVIAREDLQDKSERYYFKAARELAPGQSYLSPIDLNVENGQVEVPYQPTLRVATPVQDALGNRRAILVLNVRGDELLNRFHEIMKPDPLHEAMLLNPEGYWLSNGADGKEWGFMFGKVDATFATVYPVEWRAIAGSDHGELRTASGLFVYTTVRTAPASDRPYASDVVSMPAAAASAPYLKIVLRVPPDALRGVLLPYLPLGRVLLFTVYASLLLLSFAVAYVSLYLRRGREIERAAASEIEDLYERAPCGYHSLDRDGVVVRMNRTELDWLGYRREEVVGRRKISDLMTQESRRKFAEKFPRFTASGQIANLDLEFQRKDGTVLPVSISATAIRDASGTFVMSRSTVFDATERRNLERELMRQASTDPLTGIGNRRHFFELAEHEVARSRRERSALSFFLIDIDEFKAINDRWGHETGDAVLKAMAQTCAAELRNADVLARIGGEEFVVALPATDNAQAWVIAERLRRRLADVSVPGAEGQPVHFTVSIGVASLDNEVAEDVYALLRRADAALYQAKHAGRNRVRAAG